MGLRTPEEYVESLRRQSPEVYARGETVTNVADHPLFASTMACWGSWVCRAAWDPDLRATMVTSPDLNGEECHVFWHMATSPEDLLQNLRAARTLSERSPLSGYASIGRDELQALLIVTQRVDRAHGTGYHARVVDFVKRFQREQLMTAAAVTDVKGDRGKRPADQDDPDLYLRVVERRDDGIVVRGAKAHTSGSVVANELVVIPQRAMRAQDADYAVAFATPVDTPGIKLVCRGFSGENPDEFEAPVSSHDDLMESFTIFDDVFVPWERVFLCGEAEFAGEVANTFANVNRQGYLGADVGKLRLFIGAAQLAAQLNGVTGAAHIKSKIAEMIRLERSIWALGVTASHESRNEEGYQVPDPVLTNAGKHLAMEGHYMAARNLLEIAGGSVITSPYVEDIFRPELRPFVEKYYRGVDPGDAMERLRVMKLIRDLVASEYGGYWYTEIIHGSGSPEAEKLQMYREHDLDYCVGLARHALLGRAAVGEAPTVRVS
jgi:4-hydroxybutyryl-CoA dehydratase/vinylacetyl-CoA-Delta-isomerase